MRYFTLLIIILSSAVLSAQELRTRKVPVKDSIVLDSVSINPLQFRITTKDSIAIDSTRYTIDFARSILSLKAKETLGTDSLIITYRTYPEYLTRRYSQFDPSRIVNSSGNLNRLAQIGGSKTKKTFTPFDGLNTSGSILRGITVGNNQNSVLNSELDLQISGKLNNKVTLRASLQDANIPSQEGGFSQNLDEFDQIFIELFSDHWNIRAGDINLQNTDSYFGRFTKKVQGLSLGGTINHTEEKSTNLFATGALVRGVFTQSNFIGQEGNQGPYKLTGPNGELFVLVVSGSERVYVNGVLLQRGEGADYIIDYNAGEIRFNSTFPITSEMRIVVEYQSSERNFTRFVAHGGGQFKTTDKFKIGAQVYSEADARNQPLQQNLSEEQIAILQNAGDDPTAMVAPSAIPQSFSENRVLYRRIMINGVEVFEFSTDPEEELFSVNFRQVGPNQGDYILSTINTLQRTFEYVAPIDGISQGNFAPVVQLFAPTLLQLAIINGSYSASEKTQLNFEAAGSRNDQNLFSDLDDGDNTAFAGHFDGVQQLWKKDSVGRLNAFAKWDFVQENFINLEGLYNVEFNRDWNLSNSLADANGALLGNQSFLNSGLQYQYKNGSGATYTFENLNFNGFYSGNRHSLTGRLNTSKLRAQVNASALSTNDTDFTSDFSKLYSSAVYGFKKAWVGGKFYTEDNLRRAKINDSLTPDSQRFQQYEAAFGVGDSTKVFVEVGYRYRVNDSLRLNERKQVNRSNTYFLKSQLIKNDKTNLSLFVNYRRLAFDIENLEDETSLNSRLLYDQNFLKNGIRWNTVYETNSGTQPQQEFTFVAVDEGQGTHTFNDFNGDGIQQLEEFDLAQFQDQADFIRVLLPNQIFVQTHQNRLSQQLILNPQQWSGQKKFKKFLSHFYNQSSYIIDRRELRDGSDFTINPFSESDNEIGLNLSLRNSLFFNRGKQKYTTSYTYIATQTKTLLSTGLQENDLFNHQLNFIHKIKKTWLFNVTGDISTTRSMAENFPTRNFEIDQLQVKPQLSYLFNDRSRVSLIYTFQQKENQIGALEALDQQDLGITFAISTGEKLSLNGGFNYVDNQFEGDAFTPVGFQLLEGLQPGTNFTWNLVVQRRLTKYLDLNISYFGRQSEGTSVINTGNVQLKAFF